MLKLAWPGLKIGAEQRQLIHLVPTLQRGNVSDHFPLNLAGLHDILGEDRENRLRAEIKSQRLHPSDQPTLAMAHRRKALRQQRLVPAEPRPIA